MFVFIFQNTREVTQAVGYAYPRSHQVPEGCHFKETMCHSIATAVELVGA